MAINNRFPHRARDQGLALMNDNGCQPTSMAFIGACSTMGIHQTFTSYNNPKGNADAERFMRTLKKEERLGLQEWSCSFELISGLKDWLAHHNKQYVQSALGYQSPSQIEWEYLYRHSTPYVAA